MLRCLPVRLVLLQGLPEEEDWKKEHKPSKQICKLLNVGGGAIQVRTDYHTRRQICFKEVFDRGERNLDEDGKQFFKLFESSTKGGSRAAALEMKEIVKLLTQEMQRAVLFHSFRYLSTIGLVATRRSFRGQTIHFLCCFSSSITT